MGVAHIICFKIWYKTAHPCKLVFWAIGGGAMGGRDGWGGVGWGGGMGATACGIIGMWMDYKDPQPALSLPPAPPLAPGGRASTPPDPTGIPVGSRGGGGASLPGVAGGCEWGAQPPTQKFDTYDRVLKQGS